ncbi:MAG: hypothetical protein Fur0018_15710 [Anaerolineales bacterium]
MNATDIHHIVCAVRGQAHSRATVTRAINLALEHQARLSFIHVIDAEFLPYATVGIPRLMLQELRSIGEFLMEILRDRAERRGVAQVDTALLEGHFDRVLMRYIQEHHTDYLVLGSPGGSRTHDALTPKAFDALVHTIEALGVHVEIVA